MFMNIQDEMRDHQKALKIVIIDHGTLEELQSLASRVFLWYC